MKKVLYFLLSFCLLSPAFSNCLDAFESEIKNNETVMLKLLTSGENAAAGWSILGAVAGGLIFKTTAAQMVGFSLPAFMVAGHILEDNFHDRRLTKMINIVRRSEQILGYSEVPKLRTDFKELIEAPSDITRVEKRVLKRQNRQIKKHNKMVLKYNKQTADLILKMNDDFMSIYKEIQKADARTSKEDLAQVIVNMNELGRLCDGSIANINRDLPTVSLLPVDGKNRIERRMQERYNKKAARVNQKTYKKISKFKLAKAKHLKEAIKVDLGI